MTAAQTPETPKPNAQVKKTPPRNRAVGITVGLLVILGGGAIIGWFAYNGSHHVSTNNARVAANTANITPEIPGRVLSWNVAVGSSVKAGQVIGQIDTSTVAQSSAANAGALSQTAPLTASRSLIRAPISGQVIQSNALVGQLVNTGQSLAVIADDSSAYISANIDEADIGKVKLGQPVSVTLDALPGQTLTGRVQQIGQATAGTFSLLPSGGADTGNFTKVSQVIPVSIYLSGVDRAKLRPGTSAAVNIDLTAPLGDPIAVQAVNAAPAPLKVQLSVVGTLVSASDVTIAAQVPGSVASVNAQVGDKVIKGQVLARIDDSTFRAQLAQAQAALSQVQTAQGASKANLALAASTLDRVKSVYALGGVSQQDLQNAQTQYVSAQVAAQNASGGAEQAAQAAVDNLKLNLQKTVITSPINGIVSARNVEPGEVASPGVPLMTIVQSDPRKIVATVPASQANLVSSGQALQIKFDAFPNRSYPAKITSINPSSVATGDFYPLEARLSESSSELRAGMVATGTLTANVSAGQPLAPQSAISRIGAQNYVYVVKDGKAVRTPVQTGLSGTAQGQAVQGQTEVTLTSGVSSGVQLVSSDVNALWDGAPVSVK